MDSSRPGSEPAADPADESADDPADDPALDRIEAQLALLFRRARTYSAEAAASVDPALAPASYAVLAKLVGDGPMRMSDLAASFAVDKAAISRQVRQLVELELVRRTDDPSDRRAQLLAATASATDRVKAAQRHRQQWLRERLGRWPAGEAATLATLLEKFNRTLPPSVPPRSGPAGGRQ